MRICADDSGVARCLRVRDKATDTVIPYVNWADTESGEYGQFKMRLDGGCDWELMGLGPLTQRGSFRIVDIRNGETLAETAS